MYGIKPAQVGKHVIVCSGMPKPADDVVHGFDRDARSDRYMQLVAVTCGRARRYVSRETSYKLELSVGDSVLMVRPNHRVVGFQSKWMGCCYITGRKGAPYKLRDNRRKDREGPSM